MADNNPSHFQGKILLLRPVRIPHTFLYQFSFQISKHVNICEISVGCTFNVDKISVNLHKSFLEMFEAMLPNRPSSSKRWLTENKNYN